MVWASEALQVRMPRAIGEGAWSDLKGAASIVCYS